MSPPAPNFAFASDNTAGICPEALAAIAAANEGCAPSYGDDEYTERAKILFAQVFEHECEVFFVFNGTAANALALAALCQPHHGILCHELAHVHTDECGAPEYFTGGAKVIPVGGDRAKLHVHDLEPELHRGHGVHYPKIRVLSLTQATELGTLYSPDELRLLHDWALTHEITVHLDGARFANAVAASHCAPADLTWRAGLAVLSLGGTKNGLLGSEAVVFFDEDLAREFAYRVKQSGQLASKMRFAAAQWEAVLRDGAWLRHAAHANASARQLAAGLTSSGLTPFVPVESNAVFVLLAEGTVHRLNQRGWRFHRFVGDHVYRLMCSWATREEDIAAFLADARAVV